MPRVYSHVSIRHRQLCPVRTLEKIPRLNVTVDRTGERQWKPLQLRAVHNGSFACTSWCDAFVRRVSSQTRDIVFSFFRPGRVRWYAFPIDPMYKSLNHEWFDFLKHTENWDKHWWKYLKAHSNPLSYRVWETQFFFWNSNFWNQKLIESRLSYLSYTDSCRFLI